MEERKQQVAVSGIVSFLGALGDGTVVAGGCIIEREAMLEGVLRFGRGIHVCRHLLAQDVGRAH